MKSTLARVSNRIVLLAGGMVGTGICLRTDCDGVGDAQHPSIKRTILQRADDPGTAGYEAIMGVAEIPAGATSGKHRHHGIEVGYVLQGKGVLEHEGKQPLTPKQGKSFTNELGVHSARNIGKTPVKILAVYLVEKGKPLAEPVP